MEYHPLPHSQDHTWSVKRVPREGLGTRLCIRVALVHCWHWGFLILCRFPKEGDGHFCWRCSILHIWEPNPIEPCSYNYVNYHKYRKKYAGLLGEITPPPPPPPPRHLNTSLHRSGLVSVLPERSRSRDNAPRRCAEDVRAATGQADRGGDPGAWCGSVGGPGWDWFLQDLSSGPDSTVADTHIKLSCDARKLQYSHWVIVRIVQRTYSWL